MSKITFISAGAGSGKTFQLTKILYEELKGATARPSGVIATTFTKKAATELRERVRKELLDKGEFTLANQMGQARVGTVNSVCGSLVERFAFEAGIAPNQQVLEEEQSRILLNRALDAVLDGPEQDAFLEIVRRLALDAPGFGNNGPRWKNDLKDLVNQARANALSSQTLAGFAAPCADDFLSYFPKPTKDDLFEEALRAIDFALPAISKIAREENKKNTGEYLSKLNQFKRDLQSDNYSWADWLSVAKETPQASLKLKADGVAAVLNRVTEHPQFRKDIRDYLEQVFATAAKVLVAYEGMKLEQGVIDFVDQEALLLKLLENPTVQGFLKEELDLLMVDEFQDTSPIQLAVFMKLAELAKRVYWVGDVKQAIYGFRGSDTELMQAVLAALPKINGKKEILGKSWRSRPMLVNLANSIFVPVFAESLTEQEVALTAQRQEQTHNTAFANWILQGKNKGQYSAGVANGITRLMHERFQVVDKEAGQVRAVSYSDIAVLARTNTNVQEVAKALSLVGIPVATSQEGLLRTPEATLAMACLRRLNDSSDTIASAEVLSLASSTEPEEWVADRLRYVQAVKEQQGDKAKFDDWREVDAQGVAADPLLAKIASLRPQTKIFSPQEALRSVITECGLAEIVTRWDTSPEQARLRLANLEALIAMAQRYEDLCATGQHAASISGLIIWLGEQAQEGQDTLAQPGVDAVRVMTHHGAKGLEWPVVILMDLSDDIKTSLWSVRAQFSGEFNAHAPLANRTIRYWPYPFGSMKKVALLEEIERQPVGQEYKRRSEEEAKRLLYVSMTRPRDLLVIARSEKSPTGEWINTLNAEWLLTKEGQTELQLPNSKSVKVGYWVLSDQSDPSLTVPKTPVSLHWFKNHTAPEFLPLFLNPSRLEAQEVSVLKRETVGTRISVGSGVPMDLLGNAIHTCIATSFTDPQAGISVEEVGAVLKRFGAHTYVNARAVQGQIEALHAWIASCYSKVKAYPEHPVQAVLENGQLINGRIDLLLETQNGYVLIDHKSNPQAADHWDAIAKEHAGQLTLYARAIEIATGKPVVDCWIFLPVSAGALLISLEEH